MRSCACGCPHHLIYTLPAPHCPNLTDGIVVLRASGRWNLGPHVRVITSCWLRSTVCPSMRSALIYRKSTQQPNASALVAFYLEPWFDLAIVLSFSRCVNSMGPGVLNVLGGTAASSVISTKGCEMLELFPMRNTVQGLRAWTTDSHLSCRHRLQPFDNFFESRFCVNNKMTVPKESCNQPTKNRRLNQPIYETMYLWIDRWLALWRRVMTVRRCLVM